uniref:Uncharacterized protein n=1 Tax=Ditylenchus dipsaci TaxID=166011 RepID=A0A915EEH0_9BILA
MTTTSSISASTEQTAQVEQAVESTSRTAQDNLATKTSMSVIEEAQPGSKARPPEGCLPSSDALPCAPVSVIHSDLSAETPVVSEPPPPPQSNLIHRNASHPRKKTPTVAIKVEPREEDDSLRPSGSSTVSTGVRAPLAEVNRPDAAQKQASSHKQQPRPHSTSSSEQSHRRADKCKTASSTSKDLQSKPDDLKVKFKSLGPSSAPASKSPKESRQPCSSSSNTIQTSSLNSLQFPDMQRDHPSVIAKPKIPIRIGNQASSTPPAVNSLTDTVFTVGPSHPDGEVIQPALADIALPDPPQPPVYLRNAPSSAQNNNSKGPHRRKSYKAQLIWIYLMEKRNFTKLARKQRCLALCQRHKVLFRHSLRANTWTSNLPEYQNRAQAAAGAIDHWALVNNQGLERHPTKP